MNKQRNVLATAFVAALVLAPAAVAATDTGEVYEGKVNHVIDAETLRISHNRGGQIRVRPADPATHSAEELTARYLGRTVRVHNPRWEDGYLVGDVDLVQVN